MLSRQLVADLILCRGNERLADVCKEDRALFGLDYPGENYTRGNCFTIKPVSLLPRQTMTLPNPILDYNDPFVQSVSDGLAALRQDLPFADTHERLIVVAAFSGGPDSTALLLALHALAGIAPGGINIQASHVNHCLREEESDNDEHFCRQLCQLLEIPLHVTRVSTQSKDEASLRDSRYGYLTGLCAQLSSQLCLTGHTLDDQIETMLFRLFRGTALRGLCGIRPLRLADSGVYIGRPLLATTRADCLAFLHRAKVTPRYDSSNNDSAYSRNYIRNTIIPAIEYRFPSAVARMERARLTLLEDEKELAASEAIIFTALDQCNWHLLRLRQLSTSMQRRAIARALERHEIEPSFYRIQQLIGLIDHNSTITLNERWDALVVEGCLVWRDKYQHQSPRSLDEMPSYEVRIPGLTIMHRLNLCVRVEKLSDSNVQVFPKAHELEILADLSKISGSFRVRARVPGDRINPLGMTSSVRLKKFIHTRKPAKLLRFAGHTLLLADDVDVVWIPGCGISHRIAVSSHDIWRVSISSIAPDAGSFC